MASQKGGQTTAVVLIIETQAKQLGLTVYIISLNQGFPRLHKTITGVLLIRSRRTSEMYMSAMLSSPKKL